MAEVKLATRSPGRTGPMRAWIVSLCAACLAACSSAQDLKTEALNPDPPEKMYSDADSLMTRQKWEAAAKKFEDLDRDHPYSPEARRAIVMAAYAYYRNGKYSEAVATAQRYTELHPGTKDAPFAHNIIASSYFDQMRTPDRDQEFARKALQEYKTLKARYPDSDYAQKADNRIRIAEDSLAASEMNVGRFYQKKNMFPAAVERYKVVVSEYQTTQHVEEALMRLTECYMALGLTTEAETAAAVLGHNFPDSPWYKQAYVLVTTDGRAPREDTGSWISQSFKSFKLPKLSLGSN